MQWKPHLALSILIKAPAIPLQIRAIRMPATPLFPKVSKKAMADEGSNEYHSSHQDWQWPACLALGAKKFCPKIPCEAKRSMAYLAQVDATEDLAGIYGRVVSAAEIYHAKRSPELANRLRIAVGRAKGPQFALEDVK